MHLIPDSWSHLHILASALPSVGLVFALGFYVVAMITNNIGLTRICLAVFTLLGVVAIPTYFSGTGRDRPCPASTSSRMTSELKGV
jgi:hypothetical protein